MQKPLFLTKTLTNPALRVAHINANQVSISCTDTESPVYPCQSEPVVWHAELPQGVSNEWLYLVQSWRTKENSSAMEHAVFWIAPLKDSGRMEQKEFLLRFFFSLVLFLVLKQKGSLNTASSYFLWVCTVMEHMACYLSYIPGRIHRFFWNWYYELWAAQAELTLPVPNNLPLFD